MKVLLTAAAEVDLEHIADHIAANNPARAASFVEEIAAQCERLAEMPQRYPLIPRYETHGVRRVPVGNYLIFYRINGDQAEILHILHGARDYEPLLFPATP